MRDYGLIPEFPPAIADELLKMVPPPRPVSDLRHLEWSSIDNAASRDLDQVEYAEAGPEGFIRVFIGITDVASHVRAGSAIDTYAGTNTTSVYTAARAFPMLPPDLSAQSTSLLEGQDRMAVVLKILVDSTGEVRLEEISQSMVVNRCKFVYEEISNWLSGRKAKQPDYNPAWEIQLKLQREAARRLRGLRAREGAVTFGLKEPRPMMRNGEMVGFADASHNPGRDMIESFMVSANVTMARFLKERRSPMILRVVRTPKNWDRIQEIAFGLGEKLPSIPEPRSLARFLHRRKTAAPAAHPELCLTIVKLLGSGEYVLNNPDENEPIHFGLAVQEYTHSTAPIRRFADLVTQRLVHALLDGKAVPYTIEELERIANRCTEKENAARKVERLMRKIAAAFYLQNRVGETFRGLITGSSPKGVYVRLLDFPAEGRVVQNLKHLRVGDKIEAKLMEVNLDQGHVDFQRVARIKPR